MPVDDLLFVIDPLPDFCSKYSRMYIIGIEKIDATCRTTIKIDAIIGTVDVGMFPSRKQRPVGRIVVSERNLYSNMIVIDTAKLIVVYKTIQLRTIFLSRNIVSKGLLITNSLESARKLRAKHDIMCDVNANTDET